MTAVEGSPHSLQLAGNRSAATRDGLSAATLRADAAAQLARPLVGRLGRGAGAGGGLLRAIVIN